VWAPNLLAKPKQTPVRRAPTEVFERAFENVTLVGLAVLTTSESLARRGSPPRPRGPIHAQTSTFWWVQTTSSQCGWRWHPSVFCTWRGTCRPDAGRRTKFASVKSLDSSEFSSEFSDLKILSSNVKVNPVISWNGHNSFHRIFPLNSQDFTTPQIFFKFSGFDYTSNSFLIKPLRTNDRKTRPFREILSQRKGRGEDRVE